MARRYTLEEKLQIAVVARQLGVSEATALKYYKKAQKTLGEWKKNGIKF